MRYDRGLPPAIGRALRFESLESRTLLAGVVQTFTPAQDAYLEDGARFDTTSLRVESAAVQSTSYLAYSLTDLADGTVVSARLRLRVAGDPGSGTLSVHQGTPNLWAEYSLTAANAPSPLALLDSQAGAFVSGAWIEFDVTAAVQGEGIVNFIVSLGAMSNSVDFSSREGSDPAQLVVTTTTDLVGDVNGDEVVSAADYTLWRDTLGSQTDARADFNFDVTVNASDYNLWKANFGATNEPPLPPSVLDYGAIPDDSTDDRAAIQAAINANTSVYFPPGEYSIDGKLTVPAGRTLYGPESGPPAIIRVRFDTLTNANNYALEVAGDDVTVRNLTISKDFVDGSYGVGILAQGRDGLTIQGVEISGYSARYGIHLIESTNFEIDSVYIHDFLMNQSDANGIGADMIQDSPAGIRITRSVGGRISNSRIHNIEVGPQGRASISEFVPGYGPQGYQSDAITLSDSSGIIVENNDLWNSGELVDLLVSDNSTVRNNTMQMAFLFGVKVIGSQDSVVEDNYIGDAAIGVWMGDHSTGEQSTGNQIDDNDLVNTGSPGIWDIPASSRLGFAISGIYVDNDASGNTISNNDIYNYYGYLPQFIRQGTGSNTFPNNDGITSEFGPPGGGDAAILGEWTAGLSHAKELIALNRALVFVVHAEDAADDIAATAVAYGGQAMTKINERRISTATGRVYVSTWILAQDAINRAADGDFSVAWNAAVDSVGYSSVFLQNIYQPLPIYSNDTGAASAGNTLATSPRATHAGDMVLYAATAAQPGDFTPASGFTEDLEVALPNADGVAGHKLATGDNESASVTHTALGSGVISMVALQRNPPAPEPPNVVNVTTLGALPNDGLNDAIIVQNALNNSAYDEVYFPPGVYHFDRAVFVPSNKTVRGDSPANTEIRTLVDTGVFRLDNNTSNAGILNLTIERPQSADSNNEIIRGDNVSFITIDSIYVNNSPSRAPIINLIGGSNNSITRNRIVDYQVLRSEPSPEQPGDHTQVFGSGITVVDNTDLTITDNEVIQNVVLDFGTPVIKGVYQSSAYQIVNSTGGAVARNYTYRTGQGIDTTGSAQLLVQENVIDECHSAGIKLVNGSNQITVEGNYIRNCGLTGIWVSAGVAGLGGSFENIVRENTLVGIGKGFGLDFWDYNFALSTPAAIHLQAAQLDSDRVRNNTIVDNNAYDNGEQRGIVVAEPSNSGSPFPAVNNVIANNVEQSGPAPPPPFESAVLAATSDAHEAEASAVLASPVEPVLRFPMEPISGATGYASATAVNANTLAEPVTPEATPRAARLITLKHVFQKPTAPASTPHTAYDQFFAELGKTFTIDLGHLLARVRDAK